MRPMAHCDAHRAPAETADHACRAWTPRAPVLARSPVLCGMAGAPCPIMITLIWLGILLLVVIGIAAFIGLAKHTRTGHAQR